jgi:hypothetical protein
LILEDFAIKSSILHLQIALSTSFSLLAECNHWMLIKNIHYLQVTHEHENGQRLSTLNLFHNDEAGDTSRFYLAVEPQFRATN